MQALLSVNKHWQNKALSQVLLWIVATVTQIKITLVSRLVAQDVVEQICAGNKSIIGIMLESNINAGNQSSDLPKEAASVRRVGNRCMY